MTIWWMQKNYGIDVSQSWVGLWVLWDELLWADQVVTPSEMVRHLGYALGWNATGKEKDKWVLQKVRQKLRY